jgi:hypothetical protein
MSAESVLRVGLAKACKVVYAVKAAGDDIMRGFPFELACNVAGIQGDRAPG